MNKETMSWKEWLSASGRDEKDWWEHLRQSIMWENLYKAYLNE